MDNSALAKARSSRSRHLWLGLAMVLVLVGGLGGWAAIAEINGAVIAAGTVIVEGKAKQVQHQEGGTIGTINIRDGDSVVEGDVLFRLDDTVVKANLAITLKRLDQLKAREARLATEWAGDAAITFSSELLARAQDNLTARQAINGETALFKARRQSLKGRKLQLGEQISQLEQQISGLEVQRDAKSESIELITEQLKDFEALMEKRLVNGSQVTAIKRQRAELVGSKGSLISQMAQTRETISERRIQILQLGEEFLEKALSELQQTRAKLAELEEQKITAEDRLHRMAITAPRSGKVHQLSVYTIGQVIAPGDTLLLIVPETDKLVVEARVPPVDVDQIQPGQSVYMRMAAFDQRTTPELNGEVLVVSPDLEQDPATGESFYIARLGLKDGELAKLGDKQLLPGMPVEGFIQTGSRTVLSYFIKPLRDQIAHALKEN